MLRFAPNCFGFLLLQDLRTRPKKPGFLRKILRSAFYLLPSAFYLLPFTFYLLPSASCLLPSNSRSRLKSRDCKAKAFVCDQSNIIGITYPQVLALQATKQSLKTQNFPNRLFLQVISCPVKYLSLRAKRSNRLDSAIASLRSQ